MQELNELKNLVIQSLEANGSLSNIRAQIRASVFKVQTKKQSPFSWENPKCQKLLENENGVLVLQLIKEFLQFYSMDYSNSVFSSESNQREEVKRDKINSWLQISKPDNQKPLLLQLVEEFKLGNRSINGNATPSAAPSQNSEANKQDQKKQDPVIQKAAIANQEQKQIPQQQSLQNQQQKNKQGQIEDFDFEQSLDSQSDRQQQSHQKSGGSPQNQDKSVQSLESTSEKKALEEAQKFIQQSQNQLRAGQIGQLQVNQQQQASMQQQNKFNPNMKQYEQEQYDNFEDSHEGVEEQLNDYQEDIDVDDDILNSKDKNAGQSYQSNFEESEDYIGQSSKGHDISVDSYALENFDYMENVEDL